MATASKASKPAKAPAKKIVAPETNKVVKKAGAAKAKVASVATASVAAAAPAKTAAVPKRAPKKTTSATPSIAPDQRRHYVEIAAFYIAERRGFAPGNPLDDWLAAEAEIDRLLAGGHIG
jgi:hypothetical protein